MGCLAHSFSVYHGWAAWHVEGPQVGEGLACSFPLVLCTAAPGEWRTGSWPSSGASPSLTVCRAELLWVEVPGTVERECGHIFTLLPRYLLPPWTTSTGRPYPVCVGGCVFWPLSGVCGRVNLESGRQTPRVKINGDPGRTTGPSREHGSSRFCHVWAYEGELHAVSGSTRSLLSGVSGYVCRKPEELSPVLRARMLATPGWDWRMK